MFPSPSCLLPEAAFKFSKQTGKNKKPHVVVFVSLT